MMGKMVKNMIYFVVLLAVVLMSFGVCRQAILFPDKDANWGIVRDVFYEPYFMLYGEVFADKIDPPCGDNPGMDSCQTGRWITPAVMSTYLLVANILLINLLIAVFNNIFIEVNAISHQVWMFQRFTVVMEYEQKPVLPPPFILLCHMYLLIKYLRRKMEGVRETYDNGLKLFLEKEDLERLYDFEEECVEGYFAEKEFKLNQSTDERIKVTTERVENVVQKVEDINQKENSQNTSMQNVEFRLRKMEETSEQILAHLAVIHRFMATRMTNDDLPELKVSSGDRNRKDSSRSEGTSDTETHLTVMPVTVRRKPTRSLTEVRPDAYIFDDGLHVEVRTLEEEDEDEGLSNSGSRKRLSTLDERQRSTESKTSITGSSVEKPEDLRHKRDDNDDEDDDDDDDIGGIRLESLRIEKRRRDSAGTGRRSSEGGADDPQDKPPQHPRRQLSQTHSEPENSDASALGLQYRSVTFAEPKIKVHPPTPAPSNSATSRNMLMAMHTEYTSITDELETVCGLLSPPRTPRLLSPPRPNQNNQLRIGMNQESSTRRRHASEMSNPEIALYIEKENLRDAEECDYMLMENLIQRRYEEEDEDFSHDQNPSLLSVVHESREFRNQSFLQGAPPSFNRSLRRSSAIESDLPSLQCPLGYLIPACSDDEDNMMGASTSGYDGAGGTARQDSGESTFSSGNCPLDTAPLVGAELPARPSIVIDSSQLPTVQREVRKADSKGSLHMQSETMC